MSIILYNNQKDTLEYVDGDGALDDIYYQRFRAPSEEQVRKYMANNPNTDITKYFRGGVEDGIFEIKEKLSSIDLKVPLYDEYTRNLYLINRNNVYNRVIFQYYRFPDENLISILEDRKDKLKDILGPLAEIKEKKHLGDFAKTSKEDYQKIHKSIKNIREYQKLNLMLDFLGQFNLSTLKATYIKVFYYYSNEVGKNITVCHKPSFLPHFKHLNPYYSRSELINMALNLEIIKPSKVYYDEKRIMELCQMIRKNDISAEIILNHQIYIIKHRGISMIQYYTLQGSYFMNQYLRGITPYRYKNTILEQSIKFVWNLINNAPEFDKDYVLYRFIKSDDHLKHLKIGDEYTTENFISTTRDPFYKSDEYQFGFILVKIKIPKNIKGVGLCIETFSVFPEEQEIILSPRSVLRLEKKDENVPYYHTDDIHEIKITTKYEFTYTNKRDIFIKERSLLVNKYPIVDFIKADKIDTITVTEKLNYFVSKYVNPLYQFDTVIGGNTYTIIIEWYNSTGAYKKFYAAETNNGFYMYTIIDNGIGFTIEIGEDNSGSYMYVDYYFKFSTVNKRIADKDFIDFLAKVGYYFDIANIVIFADYMSCDYGKRGDLTDSLNNRVYHGGNFCTDIYNYVNSGVKRYQVLGIDTTELKPMFAYFQLDRLKTTDPMDMLRKEDRDELYQMYTKYYQNIYDQSKFNVADFYVWLVDNYCVLVDLLIEKMNRIYKQNNPFDNDYYILYPFTYLYNRNIIDYYPIVTDSTTKIDYQKLKMNKNEYRLEPRENRSRVIEIK